jgi:hypothetical protein
VALLYYMGRFRGARGAWRHVSGMMLELAETPGHCAVKTLFSSRCRHQTLEGKSKECACGFVIEITKSAFKDGKSMMDFPRCVANVFSRRVQIAIAWKALAYRGPTISVDGPASTPQCKRLLCITQTKATRTKWFGSTSKLSGWRQRTCSPNFR